MSALADAKRIVIKIGSALLVDPASGEVTFTRAMGRPILSLTFSPDDRALAVCPLESWNR